MAFQPVQQITFSTTFQGIGTQTLTSAAAVKDTSGAPIDLTAWNAKVARISYLAPGPADQGPVSIGTVTGNADGTLSLKMDDAALGSLIAGTARLFIYGNKAALDPDQTLSSGTFTLVK